MNHKVIRLAELRVPIAGAGLVSRRDEGIGLLEWGARVLVCPICGGQHVHWTNYSDKATGLAQLDGRRATCIYGKIGFDSYMLQISRAIPTKALAYKELLCGWGTSPMPIDRITKAGA